MSAKPHVTPSRMLLPSPMDKTPPSSTKKRALNELSVNLPPRPQSAQEFTTPEHPNHFKKYRKVSEPLSASSLPSSAAKRDSPGEDSVWGPEVEAAFMSAIRSIPKLGRRKICIGSKPCGRNELIADFIYRRTGKIRTRKQVSSHIQVLKHIRRDDTEFLALVADGKEGDFDDISTTFDAKDMENLGSADRHSSHDQIYQLSLPVDEQTSPINQILRMKSQTVALPRAQLQVDEFCVWATRKIKATADDQVSHVYSAFDKDASVPNVHIDSITEWPRRFPCVQNLLAEAPQCPVFHLRSSLKLPQSLDLEGEHQVVLRTQLSMTCFSNRPTEQWSCTTRVYTLGSKVLELKQKVSMEQLTSTDPTTGSKQKLGLKVAVPFATDFWAAFLAGLASLDQSLQNMSETDRAIRREHDSRNAVSGITIVQEIAVVETSMRPSERLSLLMWEFNKTAEDKEGQTLMTRVVLPEPQTRLMRAPSMGRSVSQPQSVPRKKVSRPSPNLAHGQGLQRSQTVSALPTQASFQQYSLPPRPASRQESNSSHHLQAGHSQHQVPAQPPNGETFYQPVFDHSHLPHRAAPHNPSADLHVPFTVPSQPPATHAMSRSFSAPTWTHNSAPNWAHNSAHQSPYPVLDMNSWNDSFIDWTFPESANYLQSEFQISSDDFFGTPSRCQSAAIPQSYGMEHTTSTAGTDIDDDALPRLGFFPVNY